MAKLNRDYAKPDAEMRPVFAPNAFTLDGVDYLHPTAEDYMLAGYKPLYDNNPGLHEEGKHWERTGMIADAGTYYFWEYVLVADPPPPPRTFRRSYLAQWIRAAGKWGAFAAFLAAPEAADLAFLWEYCTEFDEDNASWPAALAAIKAALQLTDAEVEAMLAFGATGGV